MSTGPRQGHGECARAWRGGDRRGTAFSTGFNFMAAFRVGGLLNAQTASLFRS
jgi:hypothetical protein